MRAHKAIGTAATEVAYCSPTVRFDSSETGAVTADCETSVSHHGDSEGVGYLLKQDEVSDIISFKSYSGLGAASHANGGLNVIQALARHICGELTFTHLYM